MYSSSLHDMDTFNYDEDMVISAKQKPWWNLFTYIKNANTVMTKHSSQ